MTNSWFNDVRAVALSKGVVIGDRLYKSAPVRSNGKWVKHDCPRCKSPNGFVFRAFEDEFVGILFCQKCNKYSNIDINEAVDKFEDRFVKKVTKPVSTTVSNKPAAEPKKPTFVGAGAEVKDPTPGYVGKRCIALNTKGNRCSKPSSNGDLCTAHHLMMIKKEPVNIMPKGKF